MFYNNEILKMEHCKKSKSEMRRINYSDLLSMACIFITYFKINVNYLDCIIILIISFSVTPGRKRSDWRG